MPSDVVSIAATTAGVTGIITVGKGARLKSLSMAFTQNVTADLPQIVELTWVESPTPLRFVVPAISMIAGTAVGGQADLNDAINLPLDVVVEKGDVVTVKVTSSGNLTVKIGLEWN
jgi:hypothetical protein